MNFMNLLFVDYGFSTMSTLVPVFFIIILGVIIIQSIIGVLNWNKNNHSPRLSVEARIVDKRSDVSIHSHSGGDIGTHHNHRSTTYFVSFEFDSGDRLELRVPNHEYGYIVIGDTGILEFQGTRYLSFKRKL